MARYTPPGSLNSILAINAELEKISEAFEDTVSRKNDSPNQMEGDLDLNGNSLLNLKSDPNNPDSILLKKDVYTQEETDELLAENREYTDEREANIRADFSEGITGATVVVYPTISALEASEPTQTGQRAEVIERANAQYVVADPSYMPVDGDSVAANGRVWQLVVSGDADIRWFGELGNGDDTATFQTAADRANSVTVGGGEYVIDSVSLTSDVTFKCSGNPAFRRKDNTNVTQKSYWSAGAAMFEVDAEGLSVSFTGGFTYDGNNQNQPSVEPTGFFIKCYPQVSPSGLDTKIYLQGGEFFNGTSGYVLIRGDNFNKRYETVAILDRCTFHETLYGKGKGDPSTPNALGYLPTMVLVMDYVKLYTKNFTADWEKVTGTGQYAACALNGTFYGTDYNLSGESSVYMHGTTRVTNLGRSAKKYDDDNEWVTNNGIGAIDMYGNADTLFVENVVATDCQNVPVRAKGSIKNYTVLSATLTNCHRGLQVGPSSTGDPETVAYVGTATSYGGTVPQMEFVGNLPTSKLKSVHIAKYDGYGLKTNPENLSNESNIRIRNVVDCSGGKWFTEQHPHRGVYGLDCENFYVDSVKIDGGNAEGVLLANVSDGSLSNLKISNTGGAGISFQANTGTIRLGGGEIEASTNYGVFNNSGAKVEVSGLSITSLSGLDRAIYFSASASGSVSNCSTDAANPIFAVAGAVYNEHGNSWNASERYGSAAPTSGTYKLGDRVINTVPSASGNIGWVCVTAGTPGTWKEFGTIEA